MKRENIYRLCCQYRLFTCGCNSAYQRMFDMVDKGESARTIACVIYANSAEGTLSLEQIYDKVREAMRG